MNRKKFILALIITSFISVITVIITMNILRSNSAAESPKIIKEKYELAKLDSLIQQREYYNKLLNSEITGDKNSSGIPGIGLRAKYIMKIIEDIDKEIDKLVPNYLIKEDSIKRNSNRKDTVNEKK